MRGKWWLIIIFLFGFLLVRQAGADTYCGAGSTCLDGLVRGGQTIVACHWNGPQCADTLGPLSGTCSAMDSGCPGGVGLCCGYWYDTNNCSGSPACVPTPFQRFYVCCVPDAPTNTPPPSNPTDTPIPTNTPIPTRTPTPTPTNTPTPTPTNTPTPTPIPEPWTKLKNTSFISSNNLVNDIPSSPTTIYDTDDDTTANFIIGAGGIVAAPTVSLTKLNPTAQPSTNKWSVNYTPSSASLTASSFLSYVKARKEYTKIISTTSLNEISSDGIYLFQGSLTLTNAILNQAAATKFILIVNGDVTINQSRFNFTGVDCIDTTNSKSVAILSTGKITFTDTVQCANGIFIADTIETGSTINLNQGLKIIGNLIAQTSFTETRKWSTFNRPSIFIYFNQQKYLDLLPYLSIANYEWRQIQ